MPWWLLDELLLFVTSIQLTSDSREGPNLCDGLLSLESLFKTKPTTRPCALFEDSSYCISMSKNYYFQHNLYIFQCIKR